MLLIRWFSSQIFNVHYSDFNILLFIFKVLLKFLMFNVQMLMLHYSFSKYYALICSISLVSPFCQHQKEYSQDDTKIHKKIKRSKYSLTCMYCLQKDVTQII